MSNSQCDLLLPLTSPVYPFARHQVEENRRQKMTTMPLWLRTYRKAFRDGLTAVAQTCYEETGIWFLARGAARNKDEQETYAVWVDLLPCDDLEGLPGYSKENHQQAIEFWQSWQNLKTGRLYNPLYQDPQHPEIKRSTPGNRDDYSADGINLEYIPSILTMLGATLPLPCNIEAHAEASVDTFDHLWKRVSQWHPSPSGAFPINAAYEVDDGNLDKIPQVEAGMSALVRAYNKETGMWRPEPLKDFPWRDYQPSEGFKINARIFGQAGLENYPETVLKASIDNLLAHKHELYENVATVRNYSEIMAHNLMLTNYRHDELLDAMEECLNGLRNPEVWESTATSGYCVYSSGLIGAFMNWQDLPFHQAMFQWYRFGYGCKMKWRFVADPYGNWVNVIPKEPEAIFGHPNYDPKKYGLKVRNKGHWSKKITEVMPQQDIALKLNADGKTGEGRFVFTLTENQRVKHKAPYLKATWSGAYDVSLNGEPVKQVRYNLPDLPAGWYVPAAAAKTLRVGKNTVMVRLIGPGKEQAPGAPLSKAAPFIRLGLINWDR